ncbi:molybdopterin-dependent oxidoreductase, partial [bacterium]|nr:molybdopterin-dependent oxidoreductase [bacterium]
EIQASCTVPIRDGMVIKASSEKALAARNATMEFLLINHPLDCPVCDQAGECDLQQYSYDYGKAGSRFLEPKVQKPNKDLGPLIRFNGDRCINCTRCVRFCEEITGTGELGQVERGDRNYIDTFPGIPLDNPLSGCTADICPVGALLDKDFIHKSRVWLLRGTKSVCGHCATGCNINVEQWNDVVQRLTPRENQSVNRWWMCDEGRLSYKDAYSKSRITGARRKRTECRFDEALSEAAEKVALAIKEKRPIVAVATGHATNEELFALKSLVAASQGITKDVVKARGLSIGAVFAKDGAAWKAKDGFEVSSDRSPNRGGVERILGDDASAGVDRVRDALEKGGVGVAIVLGAIPSGANWTRIESAIRRADNVIYLGLGDAGIVERADYVLPGAHWLEKDGTFVNRKGRLQRIRAGVPPPKEARAEIEVLQQFALKAGLLQRAVSAGSVFKLLAAEEGTPFSGLDYSKIAEHGTPLPDGEDKVPREACRTWYEAGPVSRGPSRALDEQTRISVHRASPAGFGTERGA